MLSIHLSVHALSYSVIIINQSIHINLSADAQNTNYACLQALVNNTFTWKSSCVIAKNKQRKLFFQGYNLEVQDVIKYTRKQKHRAIVIILRESQFICVT